MVNGINITSPSLSGIGAAVKIASKAVATSGNAQKIVSPQKTSVPPPEKSSQINSVAPDSVASAIVKSAQTRVDMLTSGNTLEFLQAAEKFINAALPSKPPGTRLRINLDSGSGRFVYQGVDTKTGEVITQFPADQILKQIAFVREREGANGIVVDKKV